jgi:hypothetical protein
MKEPLSLVKIVVIPVLARLGKVLGLITPGAVLTMEQHIMKEPLSLVKIVVILVLALLVK